MAAWAWPVVAGVASTVGSWLQNRSNARQADKQMQFQERMSSTAVQRQKADFEAAGFNPALAYSAGGASAPSGAMASMEDPISKGVSSAQSARLLREQVRSAEKTADIQEYEALKKSVETMPYRTLGKNGQQLYREMIAEQWRAELANARAAAKYADENAELAIRERRAGLPQLERNAQMYESPLGGVIPYLDQFIPNASGIMGVLRGLGGRGGAAGAKVLPKASMTAPVLPRAGGKPTASNARAVKHDERAWKRTLDSLGSINARKPPASDGRSVQQKLDSLLGRRFP